MEVPTYLTVGSCLNDSEGKTRLGSTLHNRARLCKRRTAQPGHPPFPWMNSNLSEFFLPSLPFLPTHSCERVWRETVDMVKADGLLLAQVSIEVTTGPHVFRSRNALLMYIQLLTPGSRPI